VATAKSHATTKNFSEMPCLGIFDMLLTRHVVKQLEVFEWGEDDKKYMGEWGEKAFSEY
jgi:hypothetical protein